MSGAANRHPRSGAAPPDADRRPFYPYNSRVTFTLGNLEFSPAAGRPDLLAAPVSAALADSSWARSAEDVGVTEIDPEVADTAAFCERYGVAPAESANCVVIVGRREGDVRFAACVVLATTRADVNNVARRALDVRKASFAATDVAVAETSMEYGGITPIGLPADWPVLVDAAVAATPRVVIGSGLRRSKLAIAGKMLADMPGAVVVDGLAR
jgi:prolyl-tRNA editing enzyme YbaK/EbsC (Cys-tRNA(Pro) deacylase)